MKGIINVSVVIATYNPDINKLMKTIRSVMIQRNIIFEVIVTDDGSKCFPLQSLSCIAKEYPNIHFEIIRNASNKGTVQNLLSGVLHSSGEYVVFISPGDMLFDENTLESFYSFAITNKADICFGNAIHYYVNDGKINVCSDKAEPFHPHLYNSNNLLRGQVAAHFGGNRINGTTYFRKRTIAFDLLNRISRYSKYVEDTTCLWLYLAENNKIFYYDRNFSWYERGSGISTSKEKKWKAILNDDYLLTLKYLKKTFNSDPVIDYSLHKRLFHNKLIKLLYGIFIHPIITFIALTNPIISNPDKAVDDSDYSLKLGKLYGNIE